MVFYVIVVTFLMTLLVYKSTNIVMDDWILDDIHANYWNKVWHILHLYIFVMDDWNLNEKSLSKWQLLQKLEICNAQICLHGYP